MMKLNDVGIGTCLFCGGTKDDRKLFIVESPSFSGAVCGKHLYILKEKQPKETAPKEKGGGP